MKIYVYTPLNSCSQKKELMNEKSYTFDFGDYEVKNQENIIIKDIGNSILFRIFINFATITQFFQSWYDDSFYKLREERKRVKKKNRNIIGVFFAPLFFKKKK